MKTHDAVDMLAALAYEARLNIFRFLVKTGPTGASAGDVAKACNITASTLSHHLNQMRNAGLIERRRDSRSLIYFANFTNVSTLIKFLSDECCEGKPELCL